MNKDLAVRAASAFVVLLVTFGAYQMAGVAGLSILGLLILIIGVLEYSTMFFKDNTKVNFLFLATSALTIPAFLFLATPYIFFLSLIIFSMGVFTIYRRSENVQIIHRNILLLFSGYFYTVVFPLFLFQILSVKDIGLKLFCSALMITFSCDIFAYVFGRAFGKGLILPSVSPKKTYAGAVGGLLASTLISYILFTHLFNLIPIHFSLLIGLTCGLATQTGDFFASSLKRISGVKDSGKIMPGHGGVLDRFDGLYFSGPVFFVLADLIGLTGPVYFLDALGL